MRHLKRLHTVDFCASWVRVCACVAHNFVWTLSNPTKWPCTVIFGECALVSSKQVHTRTYQRARSPNSIKIYIQHLYACTHSLLVFEPFFHFFHRLFSIPHSMCKIGKNRIGNDQIYCCPRSILPTKQKPFKLQKSSSFLQYIYSAFIHRNRQALNLISASFQWIEKKAKQNKVFTVKEMHKRNKEISCKWIVSLLLWIHNVPRDFPSQFQGGYAR